MKAVQMKHGRGFISSMRSLSIGFAIMLLTSASVSVHARPGEGREQPMRATVDGAPVYSFGSTYVLGIPPDITKVDTLQRGNTKALEKIRLKKSWEIKKGWLGGNPPR